MNGLFGIFNFTVLRTGYMEVITWKENSHGKKNDRGLTEQPS